MRLRATALIALTAAAGTAGTAAGAQRTLSGPSSAKPLDGVTYVARGLASDRYALLAVRELRRDGMTYRCHAFMAATRKASGTEAFRGSLPSGVSCLADDGSTFSTQTGAHPGAWQAIVCHANTDGSCRVGTAVRRGLVVKRG